MTKITKIISNKLSIYYEDETKDVKKKKGNKNDNWFDSMNQENSSTKKLLFLPDRVPEFFFYV